MELRTFTVFIAASQQERSQSFMRLILVLLALPFSIGIANAAHPNLPTAHATGGTLAESCRAVSAYSEAFLSRATIGEFCDGASLSR
jgi:hypothetical protein